MKKVFSFGTAIFISVILLSFAACRPKEPLVIKETDTYIVINISKEKMKIKDDTTLVDYMNSLKQDGELSFEINNGMICSVNGIDNPSDWSSCWMLYTSDTDNANSAWGNIEYNGNV